MSKLLTFVQRHSLVLFLLLSVLVQFLLVEYSFSQESDIEHNGQSSLNSQASFSQSSIDQHSLEELNELANQLHYVRPRLDFSSALEELKRTPINDSEILSSLEQKLDMTSFITPCDLINYESIKLRVSLIKERQALITDLFESNSREQSYEGDFSKLNQGRLWYRHWLKSWLQSDISIDELKTVAMQELAMAFRLYIDSQALANLNKSKGKPKSQNTYELEDHQNIVKAFKAREGVVATRLGELFDISQVIPPVNIQPSGMPEDFPAPGIYNDLTQTFLYHVQEGGLKEEYMDWLLIHEGTPGHHMQSLIARSKIPSMKPYCPTASKKVVNVQEVPLVTAEGWASYVETLGTELGLYTHPKSHAYALEWRVLRALRVLIDIGIHYEGWSDQRAAELWMKYLPNKPNIMKREINRIKNWPVQVITYVYGKYRIEQAMAKALATKPESIPRSANNQSARITQRKARIHHSILRLSNLPLHSLKYLSHFIEKES